MQNSVSKSANLCGIPHYNSHAEVKVCVEVRIVSVCGGTCGKFALSTSAKLKSDFAHTCYEPSRNCLVRICLHINSLKKCLHLTGSRTILPGQLMLVFKAPLFFLLIVLGDDFISIIFFMFREKWNETYI